MKWYLPGLYNQFYWLQQLMDWLDLHELKDWISFFFPFNVCLTLLQFGGKLSYLP